MKKIDWLLIRSFISPFITWTLIAIFIFNMQFLWKYIDDIIGKGLEVSIILELLFYQALAMVPKGLVFGVLIASVMTMGNLAEHYELSTMKSAGISLFRIMRPLIIFALAIATVSFTFSNYVIPVVSLHFKTRLHDIRKQKPTLSLEPQQFNDDFKNMVIYIGDKDPVTQELSNIKLYNHTQNRGNSDQTNAKKGEIYYTEDKKYMVIRLKDGVRYEEMKAERGKPNAYPHTRIYFEEFTKLFDMSQFSFEETNKDKFKNHHSLLTISQLMAATDSLHKNKIRKIEGVPKNTKNYFHYQRVIRDRQDGDSLVLEEGTFAPVVDSIPDTLLAQIQAKAPNNFLNLIAENKHDYILKRAQGHARNIKQQATNIKKFVVSNKEEHAKHENEIHKKFIEGFACLLFLFIGAPMGALIRKGGFGWPILVSIIFFLVYFVLGMVGDRLAKGLVWSCWVGSWLPLLVLFPMSILLMYSALNDLNILSSENFKLLFSKIASPFVKVYNLIRPKKQVQ